MGRIYDRVEVFMKLNMGCGFRKAEGYVNVDVDPVFRPDVLWDLDQTPWPFEDGVVEEMVFDHSMEHMAATTSQWIAMWKEIWRISKSGCRLFITVPHPRHENFLIDPTHVRAILPETIAIFDQMRNIHDFESGGQETKLGLSAGVDVEVQDVHYDLCEPWKTALEKGEIPAERVQREYLHMNNICQQIRIGVRVHKPARGNLWLKSREWT